MGPLRLTHPTGLDFSLGHAVGWVTFVHIGIGRRKTKRLQAGEHFLREVLA
jgi:hypothetical protein